MNIKDNPYYWSHIFCVCSSPCLLHHLFSVRKYVYFVHTILTVYLTILYTFIASAQGGAALAPRPPQSTHGLRPPCITSFVSLSCISLCTLYIPLYPTKYIHLLQEIQINASYIFSSSHLSSSILIYTLLYNLLYYQPNHLRLVFSLFHSVYLVIHFNDGLPFHSLVDRRQ